MSIRNQLIDSNFPGEETQESSDGLIVVDNLRGIRDRVITLADAEQYVRMAGKNPDDYIITVRSKAYGKDMFSNGYTARPKASSAEVVEVDPHYIFEQIRSLNSASTIFTGDASFVISFNDFQFGKQTLEGSPEDTIRLVKQAVVNAKTRLQALRAMGYNFGELVIIFGGDLVEGCSIYPNMSFNLAFGQKQQVEGVVALGLHIFDELAPLFRKVQVLAVRGNHGLWWR